MKKAMIFAVLVASLACRDVSRSPGGPSFSVAGDSGGGGCDATKCRFNARGEAASVSWFDTIEPPSDTGAGNRLQVYGFASVSRDAEQTFLSYSVGECRSWGCTTTGGGYGTIPNEDFSGNTRSKRLSTNTTGNPNFFTYAGSTGLIEITWTANDIYEFHFNGTTRFSFFGFSEHDIGQSDDASATASGSVVSYPIHSSPFGMMSTNHNVTIEINR